MRESFKKQAGLVWYELLQNAYDYNNPLRGKPDIVFVLRSGARRNLSQVHRPPPAFAIERIEVVNHMQEKRSGLRTQYTGLDPYDIADIEHGGGKQSLGEHGWGGTIAATFLTADGLCQGIEYHSRMRDGTPYIATGTMAKSSDKQNRARFQLSGKNTTETELTQTTVAIIKPTQQLINLLYQVGNEFLFANTKYPRFAFQTNETITNSAVAPQLQQAGELLSHLSPTEIKQLIAEHPTLSNIFAIVAALLTTLQVGKYLGGKQYQRQTQALLDDVSEYLDSQELVLQEVYADIQREKNIQTRTDS